MAGKVRVYELARELGLTNKQVLELCEALGIGVKSHSSSIVEAQADRVRRRAEREGLLAPPSEPEPPAEPAAPAAGKKSSAREGAPGRARAATDEPHGDGTGGASAVTEAGSPTAASPTAASPAAQSPAAEAPPPPPRTGAGEGGGVEEPGDAEVVAAGQRPRPDVRRVPPPPPRPAARGGSLITSEGASAPAPPRPAAPERPATPPSSSPRPPARPTPPPRPAAAPAADSGPATPQSAAGPPPAAPPRPPRPPAPPPRPDIERPAARAGTPPPPPPSGADGKPIPPPPTSATGKPIPPPPGGGKPPPPPPRGRTAGRPARPVRSGGGPALRPGGPPPPERGGPPGRGGPPRGKTRRRRRRRRMTEEEFQPEVPTYTPTDAPVPEGEVIIERGSTPQDVGPKLNRTAADVVRFLMQQGELVTATQSLSDEMIELFAAEIGATVRLVDPGEEQEVELAQKLGLPEELDEEPESEEWPPRPPVVTVMGHVDHGKTLLLDRIRHSNVVEGEAGGITQHIGAYQVDVDGRKITFIDTPGHEAFTAMRARGAQVTDIVVLVVAADDGVMPQTVEAINHAKAADVPIIVAINKIDRPNADPNRVMQQLAEHDLVPEQWGGDTVTVEVSALAELGIDDLLEHILLVAELEDLRAPSEGRAVGTVLESYLDTGRGPVATVLVQRGTLRVGDPIVAGPAWGRVRAMYDDRGNQVTEAGPSTPVQVLGLSDVVTAGDQLVVAPDDRTAREVAETREQYHRQRELAEEAGLAASVRTGGGGSLEDIFEQIKAGETATLNLILKADVHGSLEALTEALKRLERPEVKIRFIHRGVGGITQQDVQLAAASDASIIGFNVRPDRKARELAEAEKVDIRTYEIIYDVLEDIERAVVGMLEPEFEEVVTGEAEVREVFRVPRVGAVAGCYVLHGTITRGSKVRFLRDGVVIWKGTISSLKRFKDDVREVQAGYECGVGLSDFQDLKPGDIIETYEEREIARV